MKVFDEADMTDLFNNNRQWVKKCLEEDPEYFNKLKHGQTPRYLFIGCSDSRVPAQDVLGLRCGEIFVSRNIAGVVANGDVGMLSVLQYAIEVLKVQDIIVCGHYGCGGVAAATRDHDHGLLEHWLANIRSVYHKNRAELMLIDNEEERLRRLVEMNVREQCLNLYRNPIVHKAQVKNGAPRIHAMCYDVANGLLKKLDVDLREVVAEQAQSFKYGYLDPVKLIQVAQRAARPSSIPTTAEAEKEFEQLAKIAQGKHVHGPGCGHIEHSGHTHDSNGACMV